MIERFRSWFKYEREAHAQVLESLDSVPVENRPYGEYRWAVRNLAHVVAARRIWLERFGVVPGDGLLLESAEVELEQVARRLHEVERWWADYLSELDDTALAQSFDYQSSDDAGRSVVPGMVD
ncbi:MAG: hypothetical protein DWQ37_15265 [Planctomycetota bacterium]|nr:MAG: hypothetical protein DWQ37_15265 [Planctomycetota bacterium]